VHSSNTPAPMLPRHFLKTESYAAYLKDVEPLLSGPPQVTALTPDVVEGHLAVRSGGTWPEPMFDAIFVADPVENVVKT
jgi:hypothetical protein